jgi:hypothetical protein
MVGASIVARAQAPAPAQAASTAPAASAPASPLAALSLDRLSATRDRPLFSPTRRPPPPPPPVTVLPKAPPAPPNVTLLGTVMDAEDARAIVQTGGSANEVRRVRIGDDIDGWKVTQIEQRLLVLSHDNRSASFTMFASPGSPALGKPNDPAPKAPAKHREAAPAMQAPVNRDRKGF